MLLLFLLLALISTLINSFNEVTDLLDVRQSVRGNLPSALHEHPLSHSQPRLLILPIGLPTLHFTQLNPSAILLIQNST